MSLEEFQFLSQFLTEDRLSRFEEVLANRTRYLTLVLENVYHVHNASACLRTCDCLGIQDVHIIESQNRFEPNVDIALGANQWLTTHEYSTEADANSKPDTDAPTIACIQELRSQGYRILATSPRQDSLPLNDVPVNQKTAVIFGAEQLGVSEAAISHADNLIHIPMYGFTESFNISVSVALVFQHLLNVLSRRDVIWKLTETEKQSLRDSWVRQSLGQKLAPLCRRFAAEHPH